VKYAPIIVLVILALGITAVTIYRPHGNSRVNSIGTSSEFASCSSSTRCLVTTVALEEALKWTLSTTTPRRSCFQVGSGRRGLSPSGISDLLAPLARFVSLSKTFPQNSLIGASLEVGEDRFDAQGIRRLYEHTGYPWDRREPAARTSLVPDTGREQGPPRQRKTVSWKRS
jgi:hypothetical protein